MSKSYLIADSGGTKTDWCFIDHSGERNFFETEGYHPNSWNESFIERITKFWCNSLVDLNAEVFMFCAGCLNPSKVEELKLIFLTVGFHNCHVASDLDGAAIAILGKKPGIVAIQGTGSVLFSWDGNKISEIKGGKGFEEGDEGSGFYFGKLVWSAFQTHSLNELQLSIFKKNVDVIGVGKLIEEGQVKNGLAHIAFQLRDFSEEFKAFHIENVNQFIDDVFDTTKQNRVNIVGGYFYANSSLFTQIYAAKNIEIRRFIKRPIVSLVDSVMSFVD